MADPGPPSNHPVIAPYFRKALASRLGRRLLKPGFVRNVGILAGGTAFAQILAAAAMPLLTRLYTPDEFGTLAVFMSLTTVFAVVANLRLDLAIPIPKSDTIANLLLVTALASTVLISGTLLIGALAMPVSIAGWLGRPQLAPYLWLVPVSIFLAAAYTSLQFWASRHKLFPLITYTRLTRAAGGVGAQVALGFAGLSAAGLLIGQVLYNGLGVIAIGRRATASVVAAFRNWSWKRWRLSLHRYKKFPQFTMPEALANTAGAELPLILIAIYAGGAEAGYVLLIVRLMGIPMGLVGGSVAQVFLSDAGAKFRDGTLGHFTRRAMLVLAAIGAPPLIIAGLASPYVFPWLFGVEWQRAGDLVIWFVPWFALQFIVSPVSSTLHIAGKNGLAFSLQIFGLAMRTFPIFFLIFYNLDFNLSIVFAMCSGFFYLVYIVVLYTLTIGARP